MGRLAVWLNGRLIGPDGGGISPLDRGFTLSDGVFETILGLSGVAIALAKHLARLRYSAKAIGLGVPWSDAYLAGGVAEALAESELGEARIRITVSRGLGTGLEPPEPANPTVAIVVAPHIPPSEEMCSGGLRMATTGIRRNETSPLSRIKSLSYLDGVLARREARLKGADEALMLNSQGQIACAAAANVFILAGGALLTPPVASGVLPGITRSFVMDAANRLGVCLREEAIRPLCLESAQEAFVTNSLVGLVPVRQIDGVTIGDGRRGPVTESLQLAYFQALDAGDLG